MKKLVMALVPVLAFGCGGDPEDKNGDGIADGVQDPNNVTVVVPATPKGTISGQVLTTQQKPLAAASVTLTIGSTVAAKTAVSDEAGNFAFADVPAGAQVLLTFSKEGFASLRATSVVPDSAGNVPINNGNASFGPVLLAELNGQVKINLVDPTGRPASGAKATIEVDPAGTVLFGLSERTTSLVVVEATADAQGVLTFDKVPTPAELSRIGGGYRLLVSPMDSNGDGIFDTGGLVRNYSADTLLSTGNVRTESLPYGYTPTGGLAISYSNVVALKGGVPPQTLPYFNMVKPGENLYIAFNQPVQANSVVVGLTDEYGKDNLGISKAVSGGGTILTLTPSAGIQAGKEYNLFVRAVALNGATSGASTYSSTVSFFGGDPAAPPAISVESVKFQDVTTNNGQINNGESVYVNFNQVMTAKLLATPAYAFIGADLNASGTVGDGVGERNMQNGRTSATGFPLAAFEPTAPIATKTPAEKPVFGFSTSGYTTRFRFVFAPPTTTVTFDPSNNTPIFIVFSTLNPTQDVYESGWGVPQLTDITINGSSVTPIPVPAPAVP